MANTASDELDLARLRALARKKPRTKAGQVRQAWPEIRELLNAGHRRRPTVERARLMGIDSGWRRKEYGTDPDQLACVVGSWDNPVTLADAVAFCRYRRSSGWLFITVFFELGTGTIIPPTLYGDPGIYFELPDDAGIYTQEADITKGAIPINMIGNAYGKHRSLPLDEGEHGTSQGVAELRARLGLPGGGVRPAIVTNFPGWDGGTGQMTAIFPFVWHATDRLEVAIVAGCIEN